MSNETAITVISPRNLSEAKELATTLSAARTLPEALQQKPADVLAIVMAGAELGLAPMQSVRSLVLIKGKPTLSADAMVALVKNRKDRCKAFDLVESTATKATYKTVEVGGPEAGTTLSFTMADAQTAGIAGDMYRKYPAQMLRARCKAALCREVYPDLLLGVYDPEELELTPAAPREVNAPPVVVAPRPSPPVEAQVVEAPPSPPSNVTPIKAPTQWEVRINEAQTCAELALVGSALQREPEAVRNAHRPLYTARNTELAARERAQR